jgi:hypothetical protein
MTDAMPAFQACGHSSLRRLGLGPGRVDVCLGADSLILADSDGRRVDIPFDAVDRVRCGYDTRRSGGRLYEMRVWTHRARRPLYFLHAIRDTSPGYEGVARGLAAAVADRRGPGAVEGGLGWSWALFYGGFVAWIAGYGAWATARSVRDGEPPWVALIFPLIVLILGGLVGYGFIRLYCPRRLSRLEDLDPFIGLEKRPWLF